MQVNGPSEYKYPSYTVIYNINGACVTSMNSDIGIIINKQWVIHRLKNQVQICFSLLTQDQCQRCGQCTLQDHRYWYQHLHCHQLELRFHTSCWQAESFLPSGLLEPKPFQPIWLKTRRLEAERLLWRYCSKWSCVCLVWRWSITLWNSPLNATCRSKSRLMHQGGTTTTYVLYSVFSLFRIARVFCALGTSAIRSFGFCASGARGCLHMLETQCRIMLLSRQAFSWNLTWTRLSYSFLSACKILKSLPQKIRRDLTWGSLSVKIVN